MKSSVSRGSRDEVPWEFHRLHHNKFVVPSSTQDCVAQWLSRGTAEGSMVRVVSSFQRLAIFLWVFFVVAFFRVQLWLYQKPLPKVSL